MVVVAQSGLPSDDGGGDQLQQRLVMLGRDLGERWVPGFQRVPLQVGLRVRHPPTALRCGDIGPADAPHGAGFQKLAEVAIQGSARTVLKEGADRLGTLRAMEENEAVDWIQLNAGARRGPTASE